MDRFEKQVRGIKKVIEETYVPRHEYRPVDARSFRHLDLGFYDRTRDAMTARGATLLGDIEILTFKGTFSDPRTFIRVLVSADHTVSIGICHPRPKLLVRLLMWIFRMKMTRAIDFETELQEGGYIVTSNASSSGKLDVPPEFDRQYLPPETGAENVYETHLRRVQDHLAAHPGAELTTMRTMEDLLAMQHRMEAALAAFRKHVGYLTEEELKKLGANPRRAARIKSEMERLGM